MGADAFVDNPNQWSDIDGDGFGDNFEDAMFDFCAEEERCRPEFCDGSTICIYFEVDS